MNLFMFVYKNKYIKRYYMYIKYKWVIMHYVNVYENKSSFQKYNFNYHSFL